MKNIQSRQEEQYSYKKSSVVRTRYWKIPHGDLLGLPGKRKQVSQTDHHKKSCQFSYRLLTHKVWLVGG